VRPPLTDLTAEESRELERVLTAAFGPGLVRAAA
jgi:hypothetical protein